MLPKYILIIFQFLILTELILGDNQICKAYNGKPGICKNVFLCKPIIEIIMKSLPIHSLNDLLRGNCSKPTDNVCCPPDDLIGTIRLTPSKLDLLNQDKCGVALDEDRIVNGNKTRLYEFPWMALVIIRKTEYKVRYVCGATIINSRYILTAAHCLAKLPQNSAVQVGEYDISTDKDCEYWDETTICTDGVQEIIIEHAISHPNFNKKTLTNDIGLIRLKDNINMEADNVKPICLPLQPEGDVKELTNVVVTGWGRTESDSISKVLRKVTLGVVSAKKCVKIYKTVCESQLCACDVKKDSCHGDSGGPLQVIKSIGNKVVYVQYGIVSYGPENCTANELPGVYTKVSYFLDWILDNLHP